MPLSYQFDWPFSGHPEFYYLANTPQDSYLNLAALNARNINTCRSCLFSIFLAVFEPLTQSSITQQYTPELASSHYRRCCVYHSPAFPSFTTGSFPPQMAQMPAPSKPSLKRYVYVIGDDILTSPCPFPPHVAVHGLSPDDPDPSVTHLTCHSDNRYPAMAWVPTKPAFDSKPLHVLWKTK